MMTMMIRRYAVLLIFLFLAQDVLSSKDDFGIWYGVSAKHSFLNKLEGNFSASIRTYNNAGRIEEFFVEGGISYNLNKVLTLSGSYRLTDKIENNNLFYLRHKYFLDMRGELPAGNINLSCRLRFQTGIKTYIEDKSDEYPYYACRIKIKAIYKTPGFPLDPYIYAESFTPMFSNNSGYIVTGRYSSGLELSVSNNHSVEAEYIFQRDYLPNISDINIVSISYRYKF